MTTNSYTGFSILIISTFRCCPRWYCCFGKPVQCSASGVKGSWDESPTKNLTNYRLSTIGSTGITESGGNGDTLETYQMQFIALHLQTSLFHCQLSETLDAYNSITEVTMLNVCNCSVIQLSRVILRQLSFEILCERNLHRENFRGSGLKILNFEGCFRHC